MSTDRKRNTRKAIDAALVRFAECHQQQTRARDLARSDGDAHIADRMDQGRWAFYESARVLCMFSGRDFAHWLATTEADS